MNRMKQKYLETVVPALQAEFGYRNPHQVPSVTKVTLNAGVGQAVADTKHLAAARQTLAQISGQAAVATRSKKSIAGFKLRQGNQIGAMVTLRGDRAGEFIDRLVSVVLPRIRDFRGLAPDAFDPQGNFSLGISDPTIFPEVSSDAGPGQGLQVNIVTTARSAEEGRRLLTLMGFPFRRQL
jgi:large subunit ribosomal protein L5